MTKIFLAGDWRGVPNFHRLRIFEIFRKVLLGFFKGLLDFEKLRGVVNGQKRKTGETL